MSHWRRGFKFFIYYPWSFYEPSLTFRSCAHFSVSITCNIFTKHELIFMLFFFINFCREFSLFTHYREITENNRKMTAFWHGKREQLASVVLLLDRDGVFGSQRHDTCRLLCDRFLQINVWKKNYNRHFYKVWRVDGRRDRIPFSYICSFQMWIFNN